MLDCNGPGGGRPDGTLAARLAAFACAQRFDTLPAEVRAEARRVLLNTVAVIPAGSRDDSVRRMGAALIACGATGDIAVPGWAERFNLPAAAVLNSAAANVLDYDDTHLPTLIHLGAPIYGALLALAQSRTISGATMLAAFAAGAEVACRLGMSLTPSHYNGGYHITTTCGVIGAAVACGVALELDAAAMTQAIGIAAHGASGLIENLSSGAKSVGVGDAASNGLMAAFYAQAGVDSAATALEGKTGFLRVLSRNPDMDEAGRDLGVAWRFLESSSKPYASCVLTFPVIDAVLDLRERHSIDPAAIRSIRVDGNPLLLDRADRVHPDSSREAKLSLHHSVAVSLLRGKAGIDEYLPEAISDGAVRSLAGRVTAHGDSGFSTVSASVHIDLADGRVLKADVPHGRGSKQRPLDDEDLRRKALILFADLPGNAEDTLRSVWTIEDSPSAAKALKAFIGSSG